MLPPPVFYRLLCLVLGILLVPAVHAQTSVFTLSGILKDTSNLGNTGNASVSLISAQDSVLKNFTRSNDEGHFQLQTSDTGSFLLLIAHPSFAIYIDKVHIGSGDVSSGDIMLTSKEQMLKEVVITDAKAVVIKGDTVEYTADSFRVQAYDNVDELLKKMPGIEVGKDGKIKAYGQVVQHMTVDGEEFFSDDPAVVAKTLRASSVDKVQVYDKKSEQAAFTGVDDGARSKAINLKLKDNAKKGYFGKASAGGGLPSYWENQAMINAFSKKRKISAFGIMANTNTTGLNWEDDRKYGGQERTFIEEDGVFISYGESDDLTGWGGSFSGQGLPKTWTGGGLYSNKWLNDSLIFGANYRYANNAIAAQNNTKTLYILPDSQYYYNNYSNSNTQREKHTARANTEYLIDSSSSLKLTIDGSYEKRIRNDKTRSESLTMNGVLINDNDNEQSAQSETRTINTELTYRKRFKKKGRSFLANFKGNWNAKDGEGSLFSNFNLFALDSNYVVNQRKENNSNSIAGKLRLVYTEPITEKLNLELAYGLGLNNNKSSLSSFDRFNGSAEVFNPLFSTSYEFNNNQNTGSAVLQYKIDKKWHLQIGASAANTNFKQADFLFDTAYTYPFFNVLPRASLSWRKSQTSNLSFRYNTSTRQPSITQLQPLRNNTDPLNITLGNPDLKQSYKHALNIDFSDYKVLSGRSIYLFAQLEFVNNDITATQSIDEAGRRTTNFVNVDGNFNSSFWGSYGREIGSVSTEVGLSANYQHTNNFINTEANVNNLYVLNPTLSLYYDIDTTFDFSLRLAPSYNNNRSSLQPNNVTKYWTFQSSVDAKYLLPLRFSVGTSIDWNVRQRLDPTEKNNNVFLWNAFLSRNFLKDKSLEVKFQANDILNQNIGFNRTNTANFVTESTYNIIRRYFMLSVTWNFTKSGAKAAPANSIEIIEP